MESLERLKFGRKRDFWTNRRVLVTGHTGFKGAWLTLILNRLGAVVKGVALPPSETSLYSQVRLSEVLVGESFLDVRDFQATRESLTDFRPEIVFHMAAQALVRDAYREPLKTFETNVMGTVNLLEGLRDHDELKVLLCTTTDKVYLNLEKKAFQEHDPLGGLDPYSGSKVAQEAVLSAYRGFFAKRGVSVVVGRAGNVVGGGDWAKDRLVPDAIRALMNGETLDVRNPGAVRPWEHVLDALNGYLLLVEKELQVPSLGENPNDYAWNFGPDLGQEHLSVGAICRMASEFWPGRFAWSGESDSEAIPESQFLALDPSKSNDELGWSPKHTSLEAIEKTLIWYDRYLAGANAREICEEQMDEY